MVEFATSTVSTSAGMASFPCRSTNVLIAVVDEFLIELSQRGLRARVETSHDVAGFVLDQAAHRQGDQEFSGSRLGGVERALTLDGEDGLLDLMRQQPAISREYGLCQEIPAGSGAASIIERGFHRVASGHSFTIGRGERGIHAAILDWRWRRRGRSGGDIDDGIHGCAPYIATRDASARP